MSCSTHICIICLHAHAFVYILVGESNCTHICTKCKHMACALVSIKHMCVCVCKYVCKCIYM